MNHFLLIKQADHTPDGKKLTASEAASRLLAAGFWPLWSRTPGKNLVAKGDKVAIYLAGPKNQVVFAAAVVGEKTLWTNQMRREYPLNLSGVPYVRLDLTDVTILAEPVSIIDCLPFLSFIGPNKNKWGVCVMGGMRHVSDADFRLLTATA
jgi:hypothetical protein